jgi:hypothetical protein
VGDGDTTGDSQPHHPRPPKKQIAPCAAFASDIGGVIGSFLQYVEDYSTVYTRYEASLLTLQAVYPISDIGAIVRNVKTVPILEKGIAEPEGGPRERHLGDDVLLEDDISKDDVMTVPTRLLRIADGLLSQWIIAVSNGMVYTTEELDDALSQIRPIPLADIRRSACMHRTHDLSTLYRELETMQMRAGEKLACNPTRSELVVDRAIENSVSKYRLIADRIQNTVLATGTEALRARYHAAQQVAPSVTQEPLDLFSGSDPLMDIIIAPTTIRSLCMFNEQVSRVATLGIMVTEFANRLQFRHKAQAKLLIRAIRNAAGNHEHDPE